ncbi:MAG: YhbY family RNA-binding protein [Steroidobacteraceae bacterium]
MRSYNQYVALTDRQKKHLRRLGHALHPLVLVGQRGPTCGVISELRQTLHDHELVKVRARVGDRENRDLVLASLAADAGAELVHQIGNVGLFYKKNNKLNKILLPDS